LNISQRLRPTLNRDSPYSKGHSQRLLWAHPEYHLETWKFEEANSSISLVAYTNSNLQAQRKFTQRKLETTFSDKPRIPIRQIKNSCGIYKGGKICKDYFKRGNANNESRSTKC
jgi:hypothetical protein